MKEYSFTESDDLKSLRLTKVTKNSCNLIYLLISSTQCYKK